MQCGEFEAYFDETGTNGASEALCVAAYLFEKQSVKLLDAEWREVLDRFQVPFFHMVDCAHRSPPHYNKLSAEQCDAFERQIIAIIRKHMLVGSIVAVNEREYDTWAARTQLGTAYSYCCWQTMAHLNHWLDENGLDGRVSYFFETGHRHSSESNEIMKQIAKSDVVSRSLRYETHAFVQKSGVCAVQAPDLLAWLHANHLKRLKKGHAVSRKDYVALVNGKPHKMFMATSETVSEEVLHGQPELGDYVPSWVRGR